MTIEEAINRLKEGEPFSEIYDPVWNEAIDMAILALSENKRFDGMTNGEVIKALYPNIVIHKSSNGVLIVAENLDSQYPQEFYAEWWNAPYEKGGE